MSEVALTHVFADRREPRVSEIVGAVARKAMEERGAARIALLDDQGPEAALAARMLARALGEERVLRIDAAAPEMESSLHAEWEVSVDVFRAELRRFLARLTPGAVAANPANKTALLLGGELPPEPLLPLGDLWASDVAALGGGAWSAPARVREIAEAAGGIGALDAALRRWIDQRDPAGLDALPEDAAEAVRRAFAAGRASRTTPRIVPKLGSRTLGADLFE